MDRYLYIKDAGGKDIKISRLILGGSSKNMIQGKYTSSFFESLFQDGIQTFDLARVYGNGKAEENFSRFLPLFERDDVTIISKCCHPLFGIFKRVNRKAAFSDIENTLSALKTDHVDILLLHRDDESVPVEDIITFMNDIVKKGYARSIGVSNFTSERVRKANDYAKNHGMQPFEVNEPQFSLVVRNRDPWHNGSLSITGERQKKEREFYRETGIPCLCYSSLADGYLSGKVKSDSPDFIRSLTSFSRRGYESKSNREILKRAEELSLRKGVSLPSLALSYVLSQGFPSACIVSMSSTKRIQDNLQAFDISLSNEDIDFLLQR